MPGLWGSELSTDWIFSFMLQFESSSCICVLNKISVAYWRWAVESRELSNVCSCLTYAVTKRGEVERLVNEARIILKQYR